MEVIVKSSPKIEIEFATKVVKIGSEVTVDSALSTESENPVQNKVITEELNKKATNEALDALSESVGSLEAKKAEKDGVYSGMTVGRSIDLLGVEDVEEGSFLFRPTDGDGSIKDGVAVVKNVKGNSVVWNQLYAKGDVEGVIDNSDGTGYKYAKLSDLPAYTSAIDGHKILAIATDKGSGIDKVYCTDNIQSNMLGGTIFNANTSTGIGIMGRVPANTIANYNVSLLFYDLTKMFQAGNEPTTIEEFYARVATLGVDMNAYNEGEVVNMKASGIKSVGFNAWDEQWERGVISTTTGANRDDLTEQIRSVNYMPIVGGTEYYVSLKAGMWVFFFDKDKKPIAETVSSTVAGLASFVVGKFISPRSARYMRFYLLPTYGTTYNHDICINLSHTGYRNGEYEPYVEDVLALPTLDLFPNGMSKIGDVYDEYDEEKSVQRIGIRPYQSGDESRENVLTDGTSTLYVLDEPIVTPHKQRLAYKAWDFGTEQVMADGNTTAITAGITYEFNARDTIRSNKAKNEEQDERMRILEGEVVRKGDYSPENKVGTADDLAGRGESVPASFGFRASGGKSIKDGRAYIKRIKGNSVVWNQKVNYRSAYASVNGITAELLADGRVRIYGTATANVSSLYIAYCDSFIVGHKYLLIGPSIKDDKIFVHWYKPNIYAQGTSIVSPTSLKDGYGYVYIRVNSGEVVDWTGEILCHDLTQMFQAGNEPTTIEEFQSRVATLGVDMNAYNEGEVIHMNTESIKSVGDNAWDEEWDLKGITTGTGKVGSWTDRIASKNYIKCLSGTNYHFKAPVAGWYIFFYDSDYNYISETRLSSTVSEKEFTTPSNASYMKFSEDSAGYGTTYNHDIMISLVHSGWKQDTDAGYQPYWQDTLPLPIIRKYFPEGMKSAGTAHDEIRYNKATQKWKVVRIGSADMGSFNWNVVKENDGKFRYNVQLPSMRAFSSNEIANVLVSLFPTVTGWDVFNNTKEGVAVMGPNYLSIYDKRYEGLTSSEFKSAMQGVMLYYELAEPIVTELDEADQNFRDYYQVADFGTEMSQSSVPSAAFSADIIYQFNAVDMIREHELEITELQSIIATMQAQLTSLINGGQ